jgi:methylenetetrahydrofolate reductase (NADPH)
MSQQPKIIDILTANAKEGKQSWSFEFFPPKTEVGDEKLKAVFEELKTVSPSFFDVTWAAGGGSAEKTPALCLAAKELGLTVQMHLTCTNMSPGLVDEALNFCLKNGIRNIIALRGDPPAGQEWKASSEGFTCALDLVKYIRKNHGGDYFCVSVAGYPEAHPDKIPSGGFEGAASPGSVPDDLMDAELTYLKQKVDAGADFVITQLFFDNKVFLDFVAKARAKGITCPILPGMLPVLNYAGFNRMTTLCKTFVPAQLRAKVESLKEATDEEFRAFGIELTTNMTRELLEAGIFHIHYYTLNQSYSTLAVLKNLGQIKQ